MKIKKIEKKKQKKNKKTEKKLKIEKSQIFIYKINNLKNRKKSDIFSKIKKFRFLFWKLSSRIVFKNLPNFENKYEFFLFFIKFQNYF